MSQSRQEAVEVLLIQEAIKNMHISVVGSGYVGLVTGVGLACKGHSVVCIDTDQHKVDLINQGRSPFFDDGLENTLAECTKEKHALKASCDYLETSNSEIAFLCVGTPLNSHRCTDLTSLADAAKNVGGALRNMEGYQTVVIRSTVAPGTTEEFVLPIIEQYSGKKVGLHFGIAMNPEFLQEGNALSSFMIPNRIVIGQYDQQSGDTLQHAYKDFPVPVLRTDIKTAEMIKLASNAFLATKISFINEMGNLCKKLNIDVYDVAEGMGYDPRIGDKFLNAGIGYGGSCLPKDIEALIYSFEQLDVNSELIGAVSRVNKAQPSKILTIANRRLGGLSGKTIAVLGLAFKPDVEDIRHSPAIEIIGQLLQEGAHVRAYDPKAIPNTQQIFGQRIQYGQSIAETIHNCDCILLLTEWEEFGNEQLYHGKVVIDGRRALNPHKAQQVCSYYEGVCW